MIDLPKKGEHRHRAENGVPNAVRSVSRRQLTATATCAYELAALAADEDRAVGSDCNAVGDAIDRREVGANCGGLAIDDSHAGIAARGNDGGAVECPYHGPRFVFQASEPQHPAGRRLPESDGTVGPDRADERCLVARLHCQAMDRFGVIR